VTRRAALVLVLLAALHGAPPLLLAAPPNQLSSAASPRAGSVRDVSPGGNPAHRVMAHAGPSSAEVALVSGTALHGTWAGAPRGTSPGGVGPLDAGSGTREVDDLLLVLGIVVGVAAVVLLMTGWLLAARIRDDESEPAEADATPAMRARQRARATGRDPVLAAMGLDDEASPLDPDD
jgi:hypothetical protein